jgi:GNAT superfamily N-acetyltransferase
MADPYVILVEGRLAGYGAVWNKYDPGQLMEFYVVPDRRADALPMFRALLAESGATRLEAQTNMPLMLLMFLDCAVNVRSENILFHDAFTTHLPAPNGMLLRVTDEDAGTFAHGQEPVGEWMIEVDGAAVAKGGALYHYNAPYADIYMEVAEPYRRRGYGGYLVQELKRICYECGKKPAARCDVSNAASRKTLEKAGLLPCGHLLVGDVRN